MDELTALRQLRAQVPAPRSEDLREQRERLLADATRRDRQGWIDRLRQPPPRLWVPALAAALTLVLLGTFGVLLPRFSSPTLSPPDPDQWIYIHAVDESSIEDEPTTGEKEMWLRADYGSVVVHDEDGTVTRNRGNDVRGAYLGHFEGRQELYDFYRAALDDPDSGLATLNARLDEVARENDITPDNADPRVYRAHRARWAYEMMSDALRVSAATPEVQDALYDTFSHYPGVSGNGAVEDAAGREGVALTVSLPDMSAIPPSLEWDEQADRDFRSQLLFDPDTHTYHGSRNINPESWISRTILSTDIVDEPEQEP